VKGKRSSLRSELLFNLTFLAAAALVLAVWTASIIHLPFFAGPRAGWFLAAIVAADVLVFVALGRYLIDRLVVRPLSTTVDVAQAVVEGEYDRRVPPGQTLEIDQLASAINELTDRLLRDQARLAQNVRSLDDTNRLLVEAQKDLIQAEKLVSIGRLAAGVAHEIGNPLGAVIGYASVLRRRGADPELVDGLDREAKRIDRIVRDLLEYARPARAEREPVAPNALVPQVVEMLRHQGKLTRVEVVLDLAPGLPTVEATPHLLEQIFVNLLLNAEVAMEGEGTIRVASRQSRYQPKNPPPIRRADDPPGIDYSHLRRLRLGVSKDSTRLEPGDEIVEIVVADTGPGIAAEDLPLVFDPFYTTKAPGEGTGLGLAIVASTMAELGGNVQVASEPGDGAVFTLSFPVRRSSA
jgi:two-component system, NtrC family, sensor kinase